MNRNQQFLRNLQRFRLVTFDVTDTLIGFRLPLGVQYAHIASKHGVHLDPGSAAKCFHQEFVAMTKKLPIFGLNTPGMNWWQWWALVAESTLRCMHETIPQEKICKIVEALICEFGTSRAYLRTEGSQEILQRVRDSGKHVGIISNFDPRLQMILAEMNIDKKFDFVLISYNCGVEKPDKRIFQIALERSKVSAAEALHIGDLYDIDYMGAKNAGWCSLLATTRKSYIAKAKPTQAYGSLKELLNALETIDIKW